MDICTLIAILGHVFTFLEIYSCRKHIPRAPIQCETQREDQACGELALIAETGK